MSPASSGSLEVEKYIGACLISQTRPKTANINSRDLFFSRVPGNYVNFDGYRVQRCNSADRWAGGMPLISFANHQKRNRQQERSASPKVDDQHNPLARLAVHTQGAPLILTKTFNRRSKVHKNVSAGRTFENKAKSETQSSVGVDAVSVTSDESSGSGNSDNCLPRIIKPRKRRKKDRKPSLLGHPLAQDGFSTDSASPDIDTVPVLRPYTPFIFDPHIYGLVPENLPLINKSTSELFNDVSETPQLHHSFEDVEELDDGVDINGNQSTTVCQCRYCDPAGQIWDVDRNCYSPFLTAPIRGKSFTSFKVDSFLPRLTPTHNPEHSCLIHSMSSISLEEEKEPKSVDSKTLPSSSRDLEVSTEIVTSLNGHRDIEIKFFSSTSAESVRASPKGPDRILSNEVDGKFCSCDSQIDVSVNECKFASSEE
ncbi:hypothetical protein BDFB_000343 [Asbolus verrucosus]|uniref:Uncharacterized protein n=1 Tax=Asbolus verrucosus TaxID=1661398 RepID=A0A482VSM1_ASBVE|nr:hypothetical protein BDFB_000343 [Asbolus verrucosus]